MRGFGGKGLRLRLRDGSCRFFGRFCRYGRYSVSVDKDKLKYEKKLLESRLNEINGMLKILKEE